MSVELVYQPDTNIVAAKDMEDGQIGIIISMACGLLNNRLGRVVQAYGNDLIYIGGKQSLAFRDRNCLSDKVKVRLLIPGESIRIVSNDGEVFE